ncbi:MAG: hypothetical protein JWR07_450 [Nevskia sp.]|nr:hypothetical protein [Nevskia sp.]
MTPSGALTTLATFSGSGTNCQGSCIEEAMPGLVLAGDGDFYGTAFFTGANGLGSVFKVSPTGALTTLFNFDGTHGESPIGLVLAGDGNFYGTTSDGGASGDGTLFRMTPSGTLTTLFSFQNLNGSPGGLTIGSDGNFYGATGDGLVYKFVPGTIAPAIAPTNLAASDAGTLINLTWPAVSGATGYNVYVGTSPGGESSTPISLAAGGTSLTISDHTLFGMALHNGTTYYFKIAAVNGAGEGPKSIESSATYLIPVPAALSASPGPSTGQVTLTWSPGTNIQNYAVYQGVTPGGEGASPIKTVLCCTTTIGNLVDGMPSLRTTKGLISRPLDDWLPSMLEHSYVLKLY